MSEDSASECREFQVGGIVGGRHWDSRLLEHHPTLQPLGTTLGSPPGNTEQLTRLSWVQEGCLHLICMKSRRCQAEQKGDPTWAGRAASPPALGPGQAQAPARWRWLRREAEEFAR